MDVREVQRSLAPNEALLEFFSISDQLVTFVVRRDGVAWRSQPVGRDALAERVKSARSISANPPASEDAPLRALHALLIAPLERAHLLDGVRDLDVVTHGALAYLPFAALRRDGASGGRYLVEDYNIATLGSASALAALRARAPVAAPDGASILAPLPGELQGSREEAYVVAASYGGTTPVIGAGATEAALRTALGRAVVVHVATHGVFDARSPMFSGIRLVAPRTGVRAENDGPRHGMLEADAVQRVVELDIDSEVVRVELEAVAGRKSGFLRYVQGQGGHLARRRKCLISND